MKKRQNFSMQMRPNPVQTSSLKYPNRREAQLMPYEIATFSFSLKGGPVQRTHKQQTNSH